MRNSIILNSDSYKYSQWPQYPAGTEYVYSYIESRGGIFDKMVFMGTQPFIKEYLTTPITMADINFAEKIIKAHGEPFNREGWEYIVKEHGGKLPVEIKAVSEGTILPLQNVLVTIVNTDPKCYWLTSFLETALLRAIWYPTTVASNSYHSKRIINKFLQETGDPTLLSFKLHDFGARGVSSRESAELGAAAHLVNFMGTDTVSGLIAAMKYYNTDDVVGFSIPAMEHSTVTSWGRDHEVDAFRNMLNLYAKPGALVACVSDSYDIFAACKKWGTELKQQVIDSGAVVVIRPDSGEPASVVVQCLHILDTYFGSTINNKKYKVLNNVRIIQGDGIDHASIQSILFSAQVAGFSADNIAFGQGGALLQQVNRDTLKFAMKCSAAMINGEWVDVYKDPATDTGKKSKKGRLMLIKVDGEFRTVPYDARLERSDWLETRFINGESKNETTFEQIRTRANSESLSF